MSRILINITGLTSDAADIDFAGVGAVTPLEEGYYTPKRERERERERERRRKTTRRKKERGED